MKKKKDYEEKIQKLEAEKLELKENLVKSNTKFQQQKKFSCCFLRLYKKQDEENQKLKDENDKLNQENTELKKVNKSIKFRKKTQETNRQKQTNYGCNEGYYGQESCFSGKVEKVLFDL